MPPRPRPRIPEVKIHDQEIRNIFLADHTRVRRPNSWMGGRSVTPRAVKRAAAKDNTKLWGERTPARELGAHHRADPNAHAGGRS